MIAPAGLSAPDAVFSLYLHFILKPWICKSLRRSPVPGSPKTSSAFRGGTETRTGEGAGPEHARQADQGIALNSRLMIYCPAE